MAALNSMAAKLSILERTDTSLPVLSQEKDSPSPCMSPGYTGAVIRDADHAVQEKCLEGGGLDGGGDGGGRDGGIWGEDDSREKEKGDTNNGSSAD